MNAALEELLGSRDVVTVRTTDTVRAAAERMADEHVGSLVVVDADGAPVGMLTDRDLVVRVVARPPERPKSVEQVMTTPLISIDARDAPELAIETMRRHGIRRVPVLADGRLAGIVALDDVLRALGREIADLEGSASRPATR